jgi:hypothetical protein
MNRENILKVADAIEHAAKKRSRPKLGFNMGAWFGSPEEDGPDRTEHSCDTTACIGGWTNTIFKNAEWDVHAAERSLGLSSEEGGDLFFPDVEIDLKDITPAHAVTVLRHLAETGKVDWTVGAPADA